MNTKFEASKLKRELLRSGKKFEFYASQKNKFGEPTPDSLLRATLLGIDHEINSSYIGISTKDTTQVREGMGKYKKRSKILCLWESIVESGIKIGDYTVINDKKFKVAGVTNVQEWNIIADISLEVVDDGSNVSL
jgi:hypothetical protein